MITRLDEETINQIAAGEVIERPAAVVKELMENAMDAGANAVTVEIKDGGLSMIRVTDNGGGIPSAEIPVAFERHATSKIESAEDLLSVTSLGFRGEALSSIAAVAQVELVTKTTGSLTGTRYLIEGGSEKLTEEIGCPEGTTMIVRNLFFNTPARRKFLKSGTTEAGYVGDLVERLAISHPQTAITFIHNNQVRLHTSGNHNIKDIIYHIYGRDIAAQVLPVAYQADGKNGLISVEGYAGKPLISRGNRNYMNYFINGRYIRSTLINQAIEDAYRPFTMKHKYPFTALSIQIPSDRLDVNVHPAKLEVRFQNQETVFEAIQTALSQALHKRELIPEVTLEPSVSKTAPLPVRKEKLTIPEPFETVRRGKIPEAVSEKKDVLKESAGYLAETKPDAKKSVFTGSFVTHHAPSDFREPSDFPEKTNPTTAGQNERNHPASEQIEAKTTSSATQTECMMGTEPPDTETPKIGQPETELTDKAEQIVLPVEEKLLSPESLKDHKIIGQIFDTYWIVQFRDKMFLIDQHAAHEKVLYERTMAAMKNHEALSQMLEPPIILTLSLREQELVEKYRTVFFDLGFVLEAFGGDEISVRAVPANLTDIAKKDLLLEMIDDLASGEREKTPDLLLDRVASLSCKAAVKGNHRLSSREAAALIDELLTLENPYHCPHGRPTIISMSRYEIEKKFKRVL